MGDKGVSGLCHWLEERASHNMLTTQSTLQLKHYGMQGSLGQELCTFNDNNYCTREGDVSAKPWY